MIEGDVRVVECHFADMASSEEQTEVAEGNVKFACEMLKLYVNLS
jgi:hypothetical protein